MIGQSTLGGGILLLLLRDAVALNASVGLASRSECNGPWEHGIRIHTYNIRAATTGPGVTNKNAADSLGDMAFIFGGSGYPEPRGVKQYYDGILEMNHLSVSSFGDFLQCNHPEGSSVYTCKCPLYHDNGKNCDMARPGKIQNSHSNNHVWYSFPAAGKGKYWDYENENNHNGGCRKLFLHAKCIIDNLAAKAKSAGKKYKGAACSGKCNPNSPDECANCVIALSDTEKKSVWDNAFWKGDCSDLFHPEDPMNRRRSRRRTVKFGPTSGRDDEEYVRHWEEDEVLETELPASADNSSEASPVIV